MKFTLSITIFLCSFTIVTSLPSPPPKGIDQYFDVSASVENRYPANPLTDLTDPAEVISLLNQSYESLPISGKYRIYGQLCQPSEAISPDPKPLQILFPGNSYDHTYFNGLMLHPVPSNKNSWASYALARGYSTLSWDRLVSGKSEQILERHYSHSSIMS